MRLKSYFSGTVEAAMELARKELGEDALLVHARPAMPETRHLGAYEVVFGSNAPLNPHPAAPKTEGATPDHLRRDLAEMKREIERLSKCLSGARIFSEPASEESERCAHLIANELDPMIAQAVARGASLDEFFQVDATLGRRGANRAVVALVGPPGAGKTTTLVKLAARYGLASRKPAQILSADVFRIAAADQLRSLAAILGIGCDVVETPVALAQAIEEHRHKDFVFIDTPGLGRDDMEDGTDLARLIASHPEIDTHLVLSASMKPADMARVIERYEIFQPKKFLFTRIDETASFGALLNEAWRRERPISFLATGQQIPDDLEAATREKIGGLITGPAICTRTAGAAA
ncbi:MAG TPA: GTPase [Bryobacteraceae bacterium]|jgi:flagellar biosynthesis protein FlhF|nr:GTPase [Bryobacteraceae bacterium]